MTSGERMVFAAEFVRVLGPYQPDARREIAQAVRLACAKVEALRLAPGCRTPLGEYTESERAMLEDMLSTGGDR